MEENNTVDNKRDYNAIEDKSLFNTVSYTHLRAHET